MPRYRVAVARVAFALVLIATALVASQAPAAAAGTIMVDPTTAYGDLTRFNVNGAGFAPNLGSGTPPAPPLRLSFNGVFVQNLNTLANGTIGIKSGGPLADAVGYDVSVTNAQCGDNVVSVAEPAPGPTHTATITLICQSISVSSAEVIGSLTQFTVNGQGFSPAYYANVSFDGQFLGELLPSATGTISGSYPVQNAACGLHTVTVDRGRSTGVVLKIAALAIGPPPTSASTSIVVLCPGIAATPATISKSRLPASVTIVPNDSFDYGTNDQLKPLTLDGDPVGTFGYHEPIAVTVDPPCGDHTFTLSQPSPAGLLSASAPFTVVCPHPVLSLDPPTLLRESQPRQVLVHGTDFDTDWPVAVLVDGHEVDADSTDANGVTDVLRIVSELGCGPHTVTVQELANPDAKPDLPSADATLTVLCVTPHITLSPATILRESQPRPVTVHASGFAPDWPVAVSVDGTQQATTDTGKNGAKDVVITVAGLGCGPHTVTVQELPDPTPNPPMPAASATLTVKCVTPQVSVIPAVILRESQPRPVAVHASGFAPDWPVAVLVDGAQQASTSTNSSGVKDVVITVAGLSCGPHAVTVRELPNPGPNPAMPEASATLTVRCVAALSVNPAVIPAGMTTHVTGTGFAPGKPVILTWKLTDGSTATVNGAPVVASAKGVIDFYCLVLPHESTGGRQLIGTDTTVTATAAAVVAGGTMQPSGSDPQIVFRR